MGDAAGGEAAPGRAGPDPSYCDVMPILQTPCRGIVWHGAPGSPATHDTDFFDPSAG